MPAEDYNCAPGRLAIRRTARVTRRRGSADSPSNTALTRNAYFLILTTGINAVLGIGYWAVATRLFSREEVGTSGALISLMMLLANLSQFNLSSGLPLLLQRHAASARRIVGLSYIGCSMTGAIVTGAVLLLSTAMSWGGLTGSLPFLLGLGMTIAVAQWTIFVLQDSVLTGLRRAYIVPLENLVFGVVKLLLLYIIGTKLGSNGIVWSWILAVPVIAVPLNVIIFRRYLPAHEAGLSERPLKRSNLLRFIGVDYLSSLFGQMSSNLVPVIVGSTLGAIPNSSFYSAWILVLALDTIAANFAISFTVEATREPARFAHTLGQMQRRTAQLLTPTLVAIMIGAPILMHVYGAQYAASSTGLLRILLIGTAVRAVNLVAMGMHRGRGAIGEVLKIQVIIAVSVLVSIAVLLPGHGVVGVAWAYTAGNAIAAVVSLRDLRKARHALAAAAAPAE